MTGEVEVGVVEEVKVGVVEEVEVGVWRLPVGAGAGAGAGAANRTFRTCNSSQSSDERLQSRKSSK